MGGLSRVRNWLKDLEYQVLEVAVMTSCYLRIISPSSFVCSKQGNRSLSILRRTTHTLAPAVFSMEYAPFVDPKVRVNRDPIRTRLPICAVICKHDGVRHRDVRLFNYFLQPVNVVQKVIPAPWACPVL